MTYELIDPIIYPWAKKHTLYIDTEDRDDEVRSIDTVDTKGNRFQIWFNVPVDGIVKIGAANNKSGRLLRISKYWEVNIDQLPIILDEVLATVKSWMAPEVDKDSVPVENFLKGVPLP